MYVKRIKSGTLLEADRPTQLKGQDEEAPSPLRQVAAYQSPKSLLFASYSVHGFEASGRERNITHRGICEYGAPVHP